MASRKNSQGPAWAVSTAALVLLVVVIAGVWQFWLLQGSLQRQRMLVTLAVTQRDSLLQMVNEETGVRGLVATGDPGFLQIYYESLPREAADKSTIASALAVLPNLESAVRHSETVAIPLHRYFAHEIRLARSGHIARARAELVEGKTLFDRLRAADAGISALANDELDAQRAHTGFLARAGFLAGLIVCAALIAAAIAFVVLLARARAYRLTSMRDSLTGATNRRGAMNAIEKLIGPQAKPFGLVFIDLDGFKKVNDSFGHAAGDAILKDVAKRLRSELRDADEVCRLGGDEFVCVIAPPTSMDQLLSIAVRLRKAVARPYCDANDAYVVGCSVGVSMFPEHGTSIEMLLNRADRAMYDAKAAGGGVRG